MNCVFCYVYEPTHYDHDQFLLLTKEIGNAGAEGLDIPISGIGKQGKPRQSVLSPVGHSPTGADNKAYQQLPIRQEMNHVLGTS